MRGTPVFAVCAAAALFLTTSCEKKQAGEAKASPPAVDVVKAVKGKVVPVDEFIGQTKAQDTVDLVARVEGFLIRRDFVEGQFVKNGSSLLRIEKDQYAAQVERSQGALQAQQAKLKNAEITLARQESLVKNGAVSQQDYDNALYNKLAIQADVTQADASLKLAQLNLSYTDINAPFDGCVGLCSVSVGNLVGPSIGKLATIVKVDPMRVEFNIDELDILRFNIKMAQKGADGRMPDASKFDVRLKFQNGEIYKHEGVISYADNHINTSTGTLLVQAEFPNPGRVLMPGMYVKVLISKKEEAERLLIPSRCVLENQAGSYVYVVGADKKVSSKQIKTSGSFGQCVSVESGLTAGELVVSDGIQKIRPGIEVDAKEDVNAGASILSPENPQ